jgi:hypothetical protein
MGNISTIGKNLVAIETANRIALNWNLFFSKRYIASSMAAIAQMSQLRFRE